RPPFRADNPLWSSGNLSHTYARGLTLSITQTTLTWINCLSINRLSFLATIHWKFRVSDGFDDSQTADVLLCFALFFRPCGTWSGRSLLHPYLWTQQQRVRKHALLCKLGQSIRNGFHFGDITFGRRTDQHDFR